MGTTGFSSAFSSNLTTVVGAVLAGVKRLCQAHKRKNASPNAVTLPSLPVTFEVQRPLQPLRVIRFIDADLPAANAGRMVISGRMSDVCAELDRLAA